MKVTIPTQLRDHLRLTTLLQFLIWNVFKIQRGWCVSDEAYDVKWAMLEDAKDSHFEETSDEDLSYY